MTRGSLLSLAIFLGLARDVQGSDYGRVSVLILQDATEGLHDVMSSIKDQIESLDLTNGLPAGLSVGIMSFRDKPIWSLGTVVDYCHKLHLPMSTDIRSLTSAYNEIISLGGGDPYENQFGAIIAAAQSESIKWPSLDSERDVRLILLITDSPPHFAGDGFDRHQMQAARAVFDKADSVGQCLEEYYPSADQVRHVLKEKKISLAVFVPKSRLRLPLSVRSWRWFNAYLSQPPAFVHSGTDHMIISLQRIVNYLQRQLADPTKAPTIATDRLTGQTDQTELLTTRSEAASRTTQSASASTISAGLTKPAEGTNYSMKSGGAAQEACGGLQLRVRADAGDLHLRLRG